MTHAGGANPKERSESKCKTHPASRQTSGQQGTQSFAPLSLAGRHDPLGWLAGATGPYVAQLR
eukprot:5608096-Alexandrium_andersonii.AAC.1